ncbi:MAG: sulfite exporter TauE/SafE family protein [Betaproteobacteria bacterium]|nr:sulfite exporter TauE/SafE family protein [Betaproteobacteria bacterium]
MTLALVPVFVALGAFVGFLAGLLGIGGGFTIVPVLAEVFGRQGVSSAHLLPLAIGTSAATIMFTSFSSARAHHLRGAVDWAVVRALAPGLVIGSIVGAQVASALPMRIMAAVFGSFTWLTAWQMLRASAPHPTGDLPGRAALFGVGSLIGLVAGMVGTGGAFLAVPFLTRRNVSMHAAVATSAAIGWPVAVAASASYVFAGLRQPDLPPHSLGYVYLPALLFVALASMALAPLGARVAHAWPVGRLKRAFAVMLAVLGAWMWMKALG